MKNFACKIFGCSVRGDSIRGGYFCERCRENYKTFGSALFASKAKFIGAFLNGLKFLFSRKR